MSSSILSSSSASALGTTPCDYARDRHRNLLRWRNLWTILLFVFGTIIVIFLGASILLFIREDWLPGALSTLGTIVSGAAIAWVVTRRNEAVEEEQKAFDELDKVCNEGVAARAVRESHRILGNIY